MHLHLPACIVGNAAAKAGFTDTWGRSAAQYTSERSWSLVGRPGSPRRREPNLSSPSPLSAPGRARDSDYCEPPVLSQTTAKPGEFSGRRLAIHKRLELTMSALCERPVLEVVIDNAIAMLMRLSRSNVHIVSPPHATIPLTAKHSKMHLSDRVGATQNT